MSRKRHSRGSSRVSLDEKPPSATEVAQCSDGRVPNVCLVVLVGAEHGVLVDCHCVEQCTVAGAVEEVGVTVPVVVRLEGNNAEKGSAILADSGLNIIAATSLKQAAESVVAAAGGC